MPHSRDDAQRRVPQPPRQRELLVERGDVVPVPRDQQGPAGDRVGVLPHRVRDRGPERLQQRLAVGESAEVAVVLLVDPPAQRPVARLGHDLAHDPHDRRAAEQRPGRSLGQQGGGAVVGDRELRQHCLRAFESRRRDRVDERRARRLEPLREGVRDDERAEGVAEDRDSPAAGRGSGPLERGDQRAEPFAEERQIVLATRDGRRLSESREIGHHDSQLRRAKRDRLGESLQTVVIPAEAVHEHQRRPAAAAVAPGARAHAQRVDLELLDHRVHPTSLRRARSPGPADRVEHGRKDAP